MLNGNRFKKIYLLLGDLALLYAGLFVALTARYASTPTARLLENHLVPFTIINLSWIVIFYIAGFYDIKQRQFFSFAGIAKTMSVAGIVAILIFYLFPGLGITPKTNLLSTIIFSFVFIWIWRKFFFRSAIKGSKTKIYFLKEEIKEVADFIKFLAQHPQLGYEQAGQMEQADIIVAPEDVKKDTRTIQLLYKMTLSGKTIMSFDKLYESITGKIPVSLVGETWFLENLMELNKQDFEKFKRIFDIVFGLIIFTLFVFVFPFVALAIKLTSEGSIFYHQKRVGKNGKIFNLIKFRSMIMGAEKEKNGWSKPDNKDARITFIGNALRKTRIDELPQVWNVLQGDMSFIGPRPERPEFVEELVKEVPHYSMRHLIKPGLTGWSQINFGDASAKDAHKKLQYDLYYIKNRSLILDMAILLKTIMVVLSRKGK